MIPVVRTGPVQSSPGPVRVIFGLESDRSKILADWYGLGPDQSTWGKSAKVSRSQ